MKKERNILEKKFNELMFEITNDADIPTFSDFEEEYYRLLKNRIRGYELIEDIRDRKLKSLGL